MGSVEGVGVVVVVWVVDLFLESAVVSTGDGVGGVLYEEIIAFFVSKFLFCMIGLGEVMLDGMNRWFCVFNIDSMLKLK